MRTFLLATASALAANTAAAGGLDRTNQPIGIIFEQGNYAELSFASTIAEIGGTGVGITDPATGTVLLPAGTAYGDVAGAFNTAGGGLKYEFTDKFSLSLIFDTPFGSDVVYAGSPFTTELGGTSAISSSSSLTAVGRYKFSDRFSVHGGVRHQRITGNITLSGLAYGGLSGYNVDLAGDTAFGYVVGAAYEVPEIALRVAATYNSEITHTMPTTETVFGVPLFGPSLDTEVKSPASINLDFQTGLNKKTLLFGTVRYAKWSDLIISPQFFDDAATDGVVDGVGSGVSISDLEDTISYTLGIGRRLNENWSISGVIGYEPADDDDLISPLAPTNGNWSVGIGAQYRNENVVVSGGIRYTMLGDAFPETGTPDVARADFQDNSAITAGLKIGFFF